MPFPYLYDPSGTLPANLISAEHRVVTPPVDPDRANYIAFQASPFFAVGFELRDGPGPSDDLFIEGVDYIFTHHFVEASQYLNKPIYGSILFLNQAFSGSVYATYQTLGGPYTLDDYTVIENLTRSLYNIRVVTWTQLVGLPAAFPVLPHPHDSADLTGMADVVDVLNDLVTAVQGNAGNVGALASTLANHLTGLASHTKGQVGLSQLENYGIASEHDVEIGAANKYMTPERTLYAIARFNVGGISVVQASPTVTGVTRYATLPEAQNALTPINNVAITPSTLWGALNTFASMQEYGVGDLWFTTVINRDPAVYLGYGTWARVSQGRFLVGYDPANTKFDEQGETGGADNVTLTVENLPEFTVDIPVPIRTGGVGNSTMPPALDFNHDDNGSTELHSNPIGESQAFSIIPKYYVICIWVRLT